MAIAAGVSMALVMPGFPIGFLSFMALIPFLFSLENGSFFSFALTGFSFFLLNLRWLLTLASFNKLAILGSIILFLYLSVYFGLLGIVMRAIKNRWQSDGFILVTFPVFFTLFEVLRNIGPYSLGFSSLYQSLYLYPQLIQVAAYLGPWSITALIALVNVCLYLAIARGKAAYGIGALVVILAMYVVWFLPVDDDGQRVEAAIISSQVSQEYKLDERNLDTLMQKYTALGAEAAILEPDLIVFPESIVPGYILQRKSLFQAFSDLAKDSDALVIFGTGDHVSGRIYNSVAAISSDGKLIGTYNMVHLVPFGEVIPGRSLLEKLGFGGFMDLLLPVEVTAGKHYQPLLEIGSPICFESTLPAASRSFASNGSSLLAIVTNDAWFAGSSELDAHFACAVFRAVESRRYVLQAANGGISGAIDLRGRIIKSQEGEGVLTATVTKIEALSLIHI